MSFLSRIFRRKSSSDRGGAAGEGRNSRAARSATSRGSVGSNRGGRVGRWGSRNSPSREGGPKGPGDVSARNTDRSSPTASEEVLGGVHPPPPPPMVRAVPHSTTVASLSPSKMTSSSVALASSGSWGAGPDQSDGDQRVVLGNRNYQNPQPRRVGPVDLDDSEIETDHDENMVRRTSPRLSSQHLLQFEKQQQQQQQPSLQPPPLPPTQKSQQLFAMKSDAPKPLFSAGMGYNQDAMSEGDESSSFNVSTDAEDFEYENLRRLGVLPPHVDKDSISLNASVKDYTTDGDGSVFPNLQTDDEGTLSGVSATYGSSEPPKRDLGGWQQPMKPAAPPKPALGVLTSVPQEEDQYKTYSLGGGGSPASKAVSPSSHGSPSVKEPSPTALTTTNVSHATSYQLEAPPAGKGPRREFVSPKHKHRPDSFGFDDDFADFSAVDFGGEWPSSKASAAERHSPRRIHVDTRKVASPSRSHSSRNLGTASTASGGREMSVTELLERAKSKSSKHRKGSSVNSAPVLSAAFLRETHGLKRRSDSKSREGTSSVSDIIKNLDAAEAARIRSRRSSDGMSSTHSRDRDTASVRSAKERLRERRAREERRRSSPHDSSDSEDNEATETWLFDGVQGAIGPRGIAADLESLSVRSNRSHTSGGGRSQRSHRSHKSHKSQRSSRRRNKTSSSESVESQGSKRSHGSRRSRNSRSSRYSHRSTRSYISQMSEQSRSVANDLLRLEMQLAMVGNSADTGDRPQPDMSHRPSSRNNHWTATSGSTSRNRQYSSTSRRNRVTVLAPPGKLGIILANKADSKGTVVSGVRTSSALVEKVSPGDRIVAIDGEDVSLMTVSEITTIMARKSDFERTLTVLTSPRHMSSTQLVSSPRSSGDYRY